MIELWIFVAQAGKYVEAERRQDRVLQQLYVFIARLLTKEAIHRKDQLIFTREPGSHIGVVLKIECPSEAFIDKMYLFANRSMMEEECFPRKMSLGDTGFEIVPERSRERMDLFEQIV
jgi:hypothetical protein